MLPTDRTRHVNFKNTDVLVDGVPLPEEIKPYTLQECIDDSVERITTDKQVALLWSGGIDSTLAFYAMVNAGIEFSVLGDHNSIKEHPTLAKKIQEGKFTKVTWVYLNELNDLDPNQYFLVTGEIGDQCVGSDKLLTMALSDRLMPYVEKYGDASFDVFTETAKDVLNRSDMTVGEMTWAFNFLWKYNHVITRIQERLPEAEIHHFFNTDKFQCYAMTNYQESTAFEKNTDYKIAYKKWIYQQDADEFYFKNKVKYGSLQHVKY